MLGVNNAKRQTEKEGAAKRRCTLFVVYLTTIFWVFTLSPLMRRNT